MDAIRRVGSQITGPTCIFGKTKYRNLSKEKNLRNINDRY
jgi:hypothetical protein